MKTLNRKLVTRLHTVRKIICGCILGLGVTYANATMVSGLGEFDANYNSFISSNTTASFSGSIIGSMLSMDAFSELSTNLTSHAELSESTSYLASASTNPTNSEVAAIASAGDYMNASSYAMTKDRITAEGVGGVTLKARLTGSVHVTSQDPVLTIVNYQMFLTYVSDYFHPLSTCGADRQQLCAVSYVYDSNHDTGGPLSDVSLEMYIDQIEPRREYMLYHYLQIQASGGVTVNYGNTGRIEPFTVDPGISLSAASGNLQRIGSTYFYAPTALPPNPVPEPSSMVLAITALLGMVARHSAYRRQ